MARLEAPPDRLRLLQPDDARLGPEGPPRGATATSCAAAPRSTCSRTRRTSRRSTCSSASCRSAPRGRAPSRPARSGRGSGAGIRSRSRGAPAGRVTSQVVVRISVSTSSPTIESHVQPTRSPKRRRWRGRARRRGCPAARCSRIPPLRAGGSAIEMRSNRLGCSETTYSVGPAPDRERVDPRDDEGDQHDPRERLEHLHEHVADQRQREQLRDVEERADAGQVEGNGQEHETPRRAGRRRAIGASGSASHGTGG